MDGWMKDDEKQVIAKGIFTHYLCTVNLKQISKGIIRTK